jgi:hypothetical protein
MLKKTLKYPVFLELALRETKTFWVNIFENLAYGKAPHGCYITSSDFLVCNTKSKSFTYYLNSTDKDVDTIGKEVFQLLSQKLNLLSQSDKIAKLQKFDEIKRQLRENVNGDNWSNIKRKKWKDIMLEFYIINESKKYNLSIAATRFLLSTVFVLFIFKKIVSGDVDFKKGKILTIRNVQFLPNGTWIIKKNNNYILPKSEIFVKKKKLLKDRWEKYKAKCRVPQT